MGIKSLFGFGQARDKPVDSANSCYSFFFGRATSSKPFNERTAMMDITKKWIEHRQDWGQIHFQLEIYFEERLSPRSL